MVPGLDFGGFLLCFSDLQLTIWALSSRTVDAVGQSLAKSQDVCILRNIGCLAGKSVSYWPVEVDVQRYGTYHNTQWLLPE